MRTIILRVSFIVTACWTCRVTAEEAHHHHHSEHDDRVLHFSHPISTESPTPERQVRINYSYESIDTGEPDVQTLDVGGEYSFTPTFGVEFGVPYVIQSGSAGDSFGNIEVGLKMSNPAFVEKGILLAYGLEVILPTGDGAKGIGSDKEVELEPFFGFGYKSGPWELVSFTAFGIPMNLPAGEEVVNELSYSGSLLYFFVPEFRGLLEVQGTTVLNGIDEGNTVVNLLPGVSYSPGGGSLWLALNVGFPITGRHDHDLRVQSSMIMHF